MGHLVDGHWQNQSNDAESSCGHFVRKDSVFRHWITRDGAPGASGRGGFEAEPDRYHLYVSLACPWAHRTLMVRALKGLQGLLGVSIVNWLMLEHGWTFADGPGVVPDTVNGAQLLHQLYTVADMAYTGRVTVPVLWDKKQRTIVNNESSEIIRMLNSAFDGLGAVDVDLYPIALRPEIDLINARIYKTLNNGVYKCGFAKTQNAYEEIITPLFETLDWLEDRLRKYRFLVGDTLTEADVRLFTTLIRFDAVYVGHFKCNIRRIADYPNLHAYVREIFQIPHIAETVNFEHIKRHYYESQRSINPTGIVPLGPIMDFAAPHDRSLLNRTIP